jgi:hypothetical protein
MLARTIYELVLDNGDVKKACEKGIKLFPPEIKVGVIGITKEGCAVGSNTQMSNYVMIKED